MADGSPPSLTPGFDGENTTTITSITTDDGALSTLASELLEDVQPELDLNEPGLWEKLSAMIPGKTPADIEQHFYALLADLETVGDGDSLVSEHVHGGGSQGSSWAVQQPPPAAVETDGFVAPTTPTGHFPFFPPPLADPTLTKGLAWSEDEHRLFLLGMDLHGIGDWKNISQFFVPSRTPTQVSSHAQKFFSRHLEFKERRRSSINDIRTATEPRSELKYRRNMYGGFEVVNTYDPPPMPPVSNMYARHRVTSRKLEPAANYNPVMRALMCKYHSNAMAIRKRGARPRFVPGHQLDLLRQINGGFVDHSTNTGCFPGKRSYKPYMHPYI